MSDEVREIVARMRVSAARKDLGHAWPKSLISEAADALETLNSEIVIKESVQKALEDVIHDERAQNVLKMAEIKRLRDGLEKILQTDPEQHWDIASFALEKIDV